MSVVRTAGREAASDKWGGPAPPSPPASAGAAAAVASCALLSAEAAGSTAAASPLRVASSTSSAGRDCLQPMAAASPCLDGAELGFGGRKNRGSGEAGRRVGAGPRPGRRGGCMPRKTSSPGRSLGSARQPAANSWQQAWAGGGRTVSSRRRLPAACTAAARRGCSATAQEGGREAGRQPREAAARRTRRAPRDGQPHAWRWHRVGWLLPQARGTATCAGDLASAGAPTAVQ